ncbi:MAG TPA: hypothetical protein VLT57_03255 [Bryobacteraceae bacterium]|nr:hypothetical protein [Bryobacteraceae bacterium]
MIRRRGGNRLAAAGVLCLAAATLRPARAEVIDCIAVALDHQTITLSQVFEDIRLTAFLNDQTPDTSPAERKRAEERLIQQWLLQREMELNHYPAPKPEDAQPMWVQLRARFKTEGDLQAALARYHLTESKVRQRLLEEVATVHFIDYRFRSGLEVPDADVEDYYQKRVVEWKQKGVTPIPTLEESRADIEEILQKERANQALDVWLADVRTQMDISYHEEACR